MNYIVWLLISILTTVCSVTAFAAPDHPQLKAFPEAVEGSERFVITLPLIERNQENHLKVEIVPGKLLMTDGVNIMRHSSTIESRPLEGWGYTYYEITGEDVTISTKLAVPEGTKKQERFVPGKPLMIPYNSRLPIVIYAPQGYAVHYRIWQAPDEFQTPIQ